MPPCLLQLTVQPEISALSDIIASKDLLKELHAQQVMVISLLQTQEHYINITQTLLPKYKIFMNGDFAFFRYVWQSHRTEK